MPGSATCPRTATSFPQLTVRENLILGMKSQQAGRALEHATTCSSCSRGCRSAPSTPGGVLSGGEQQMLTLCRTLMGDPDLIMIDEPTEGLAPKIVELVAEPAGAHRRARRRRSCWSSRS